MPQDDMPASLLLPMGRFLPAFLAYENFQVYLKWNQAVVYSTTAAYFATRLAGAPPVHRCAPVTVLAPEQVRELQRLLIRAVHLTGESAGRPSLSCAALTYARV